MIRKKEYLIKCKDKDLEDTSWILEEELGKLMRPSTFDKLANHL